MAGPALNKITAAGVHCVSRDSQRRQMNTALRALNRFGLGAKPGEASGLSEPRGWLTDQVDQDSVRPLPEAASLRERTDAFNELRIAQRTLQIDNDRGPLEAAARGIRRMAIRDQQRALAHRVTSEAPFAERLVTFWSNHLCISTDKRIVALLAGPYEQEVIRPSVFGRFEDMVLASARHPAMLLYLDNAQSVGPESRAARRPARDGSDRGLNENYARELLELHTIGVNGGYDQDDVRELAHILTGWSVQGIGPLSNGEEIAFAFRRRLHGSSSRTVLGEEYERGGEAQGEDAIRALCRHPSTARFVSSKLVRHFVSDEPDPAAVQEIEAVFLDSEGDLLEVSKALVGLDAAWAPENTKYRTPQDWLVAALRALDAEGLDRQGALVLNALRQPLWGPPSPKGYSDVTRDWADPDGLMNRAELAQSIADRLGQNVDPRALLEVVENEPTGTLSQLLNDTSISDHERIALALAAPAFQWR